MNKAVLTLILALVAALGLSSCGGMADAPSQTDTAPAEEATDVVTYQNGELTLSVPSEYDKIVEVKTPENSEDGTLFTVSELASLEYGQKLHPGEDWGDGWLFGIERIDEDTLHEMLCYDMSGVVPFACDESGSYYVFCHPTDVRLVRESYDIDPDSEDIKQWSALNEWAWEIQGPFAAENGLTLCSFTNTSVDMILNQLAYLGEEPYTIGGTAFGAMDPGEVEKGPYLEQILDGVSFAMTESEEIPDGEFIILDLPQLGEELDFFLADDGNLVREIYDGEVTLYRATYANGQTSAAQVMNDWYEALADAAAAA